ncbi:MAG: hypothetical protein ABFR82_07385 [Nitrospirota bacterium]
MDFDDAVKIINKLLIEKRPDTFNSSWILKHAPRVYSFIQKSVRADTGGIDWDKVTRAVDRRFQRKWTSSSRNRTKSYRKKTEVRIILKKYQEKLYAFISPADKNDKDMCDIITIALVRIAQKGNVIANEEIIKLVGFIVDDWIERHPTISSWKGNESLIQKRIEGRIRCYRYSGSFLGYLFKTLEYAGRGLRPITEYSLDDSLYYEKKESI